MNVCCPPCSRLRVLPLQCRQVYTLSSKNDKNRTQKCDHAREKHLTANCTWRFDLMQQVPHSHGGSAGDEQKVSKRTMERKKVCNHCRFHVREDSPVNQSPLCKEVTTGPIFRVEEFSAISCVNFTLKTSNQHRRNITGISTMSRLHC